MSFIHLYLDNPIIRRVFNPRNIIQVGAYRLNELGFYNGVKIEHALIFEPDPENFKECKKILESNSGLNYSWEIVQAAISDKVKNATFNRWEERSHGNSLKPYRVWGKSYEEIPVITTTLDIETAKRNLVFDTLFLDCQGSEKDVLIGATNTLKTIKYAFVEVWKENQSGNYVDSGDVTDIDRLLPGFIRLRTYWPSEECPWGYAFYARLREKRRRSR